MEPLRVPVPMNTEADQPILRCAGLKLVRGGREILHGIDLQVSPGEVIGLIGRNGAGKSSLLESLLGFHPLEEGSVELWGRAVRALDARHKRRIALVTQRDELLDGLTGDQQIRLISSFYPNWDHALVQRLVGSWELPTGRAIRSYSLGQRQRLSIILSATVQKWISRRYKSEQGVRE